MFLQGETGKLKDKKRSSHIVRGYRLHLKRDFNHFPWMSVTFKILKLVGVC